eukprot:jgi/Antlo1/852/1963
MAIKKAGNTCTNSKNHPETMPEIILKPFEEYRFEISEEQELKIFVIEGNCEILGQELLNERWYVFKNMKSFIYTLKGCKIRVEGSADLQYVSDDTNVIEIIKLFLGLSREQKTILVLGKSRSTIALMLVNFFARIRRKVILTELDPACGALVFPSVIGSTMVDKTVEFSKGFDMHSTLAYFYGSTKITDRDRYIRLAELLAKKEQECFRVVIGPNDLELIDDMCRLFAVERIIVVGNERLYHTIPLEIEKVKIRASGGVVEESYSKKIRDYFYGRNNELTPFSLNLRDNRIFSKEHEMLAPESALPLGATRKMQASSVKEVEFQENFIMGIMDCQDEEQILTAPVLGFFLALEKETKRVLAPQSRLPSDKFLFRGDLKYFEG